MAGLIERNESVEEVARRESLEEAGLEIGELRRVGGMYASPGVFSEHVTIFVGCINSNDAGGIFGIDHEHEDILAFTCTFSDAMEMIGDGRILVSHTILALQWLALHKDEIRELWA